MLESIKNKYNPEDDTRKISVDDMMIITELERLRQDYNVLKSVIAILVQYHNDDKEMINYMYDLGILK